MVFLACKNKTNKSEESWYLCIFGFSLVWDRVEGREGRSSDKYSDGCRNHRSDSNSGSDSGLDHHRDRLQALPRKRPWSHRSESQSRLRSRRRSSSQRHSRSTQSLLRFRCRRRRSLRLRRRQIRLTTNYPHSDIIRLFLLRLLSFFFFFFSLNFRVFFCFLSLGESMVMAWWVPLVFSVLYE